MFYICSRTLIYFPIDDISLLRHNSTEAPFCLIENVFKSKEHCIYLTVLYPKQTILSIYLYTILNRKCNNTFPYSKNYIKFLKLNMFVPLLH